MEELVETSAGLFLIKILIVILVFLFLRWFWCWYWKINARLQEQQKTNQLLQDIFNVLIQGNQINAIAASKMTDLETMTEKMPNENTLGRTVQNDGSDAVLGMISKQEETGYIDPDEIPDL